MEIRYPSYPIVQATSRNTYVLDMPYRIKNIMVPKGFETDGLTLKFRLLRLVVNKYSPKFLPFALVHDYLCEREKYALADTIGQEVLFEIENSWRTRLMLTMVKLYHRIKYKI